MKEELSRTQQVQQRLAVLIDADNISAALAGDIFKKVCAIGMPIARSFSVRCLAGGVTFLRNVMIMPSRAIRVIPRLDD